MPFPKGWFGIVGGLSSGALRFWLAAQPNLTHSWASEYFALLALSVVIYIVAAVIMGGSDP